MKLSAQVKKYRVNMNLSQEELAEKIYVTRQTNSNWENRKNSLSRYAIIYTVLLAASIVFAVSFIKWLGLSV